jgi:cytochrome c biogenesis protein CcmG/thiol:disulfide interchange protein DsbE
MRRGRVIGWTVLVAAVVVAAYFGLSSTSAVTGRRAPSLPSEHLSGPPATLTSALAQAHGKPILVVFWASWCEPCQHEAPAFESFARSAAGSGRVIGVDWSDALAGARQFVRRYGWSFPNVRDAEGTVGNAYRLTGLPTTFVVSSSGRITAVLHGPQTTASLAQALGA